MKINLGSKPLDMPMNGPSRVWYPNLSFDIKSGKGWPIGEEIEADAVLVVTGIRKSDDGKGLRCDVEVHAINVEDPKSNMEKAGY